MRQRFVQLFSTLAVALHAAAVVAGPVNINTADAETLALELTGVGPALAAAIVEYRERFGAFESPEALTRVSGIGQRVLDMNRDNILVSDS
jgi:competence protein ComEA